MPPKAILFDYDGVLTLDRTGSLTTNRFLSERTGISYDRVSKAFRRFNRALNEGSSSYAEIWPGVCAELECDVPIGLLEEAFESTPINEPMWRLARDLRKRYRVGIITDNKKDRMEYLMRHQRLREVFDPIVISAEVGTTKVDSHIFQVALRSLGVEAVDSVFIDNTPGNLVAAVAIGMKAVWFDDNRNDVGALTQFLATEFGVQGMGFHFVTREGP